jgi:hypothetical protein
MVLNKSSKAMPNSLNSCVASVGDERLKCLVGNIGKPGDRLAKVFSRSGS